MVQLHLLDSSLFALNQQTTRHKKISPRALNRGRTEPREQGLNLLSSKEADLSSVAAEFYSRRAELSSVIAKVGSVGTALSSVL
jgi:hypothetical protein